MLTRARLLAAAMVAAAITAVLVGSPAVIQAGLTVTGVD